MITEIESILTAVHITIKQIVTRCRAIAGRTARAVNFDTYCIIQQHSAVSLPQHSFLVGVCLQTAVKYLSIRSTW